MCSFEGIHQRHDKGDAQEESQRRCTVKNADDDDDDDDIDTLALAIRVADQVLPAHREPDALPHRQHEAQSRFLSFRHIRLLGRRRTRNAIETPAHHAAHDACAQGRVGLV